MGRINVRRVILLALLIICFGGLFLVYRSTMAVPTSQTPAPSGSLAYRTIPMNQLTGADWLTMSFSERETVIKAATEHIRCPSDVTANDLSIGVTQAAQTTVGQSQKVVGLLGVLFVLDGCVTG